jgi:hypothetical protein
MDSMQDLDPLAWHYHTGLLYCHSLCQNKVSCQEPFIIELFQMILKRLIQQNILLPSHPSR